jgi:hypothetical protein
MNSGHIIDSQRICFFGPLQFPLGAFAKLWNVTIRFMSVRLSMQMVQVDLDWTDFREIWYLCFEK